MPVCTGTLATVVFCVVPVKHPEESLINPRLFPSFAASAAALCLALQAVSVCSTPVEAVFVKSVAASSVLAGYTAGNAVDGQVSDRSRWVSAKSDQPHWLIAEFGKPVGIAGVHLYSGWRAGQAISALELEYRKAGAWQKVPGGAVSDNTQMRLAIAFGEVVTTDALRLVSSADQIRVRELVVWPAGTELPRLGTGVSEDAALVPEPPAAMPERPNHETYESSLGRGGSEVRFAPVKNEAQMVSASGTRLISGVYPHFTTYSQSRKDGRFFKKAHQECGIGGIIPWADKLWMITYAPHQPLGSDHKLYSIDAELTMTIHAESVGGTPAARMIHEESEQLFIAHYAIDKQGKIRVIDPKKMPARVTAIMRHLVDPANYVYLYDMENMFYEVNVHSLEFTRLFEDPIPGYHGKGGFTAQGKVVVSNNGETGGKLDHRGLWQVPASYKKKGPEDRGCLATFDGSTWEVIERRQYTEVTGPQGVAPTAEGKNDPVWAIGWDKRSLRLQVMEDGAFTTFLLPKGCLNNDAEHGWFTEWPRIRDIGQDALMMDMHGLFFAFPKRFTAGNCAGIEPIASHIRYIPDFCSWNGQLVLATDEASIQGNPLVGQPQSNLWFGKFEDLKQWGPRNGAGSIYMNDPIGAGVASAPFLMNGFPRCVVHLAADRPVSYTLQIDKNGDGSFSDYKTFEVDGYRAHLLPEDFAAQWIRVTANRDCNATVSFHLTDDTYQNAAAGAELFQAVAELDDQTVTSALLFPAKRNRHLRVINGDSWYDFTKFGFDFQATHADAGLKKKLTVRPEFEVDDASVILISHENRAIVGKKGNRTVLRLPKGSDRYDRPFEFGHPRMHREIESERMMANIHGTFYEVPFWIVGQPALYTKMRPVCSHNKQISDFTTWNGLLVLAGLKADAQESNHVYKSADGGTSLWLGGIDDLWKLGKPVGVGGPWKDTAVTAGVPSDPYLMTGYDQKTLELSANQDCAITVAVDIDHWTGFHTYQTFQVEAGRTLTHKFPEGYAAHWVRVTADKDVTATAWFVYQ